MKGANLYTSLHSREGREFLASLRAPWRASGLMEPGIGCSSWPLGEAPDAFVG